MTKMKSKVLKSTQEQALGAWVDYLNQVRLDRLVQALSAQDKNLENALASIEWAFSTISENIIGRNRGGDKGMHGFIAEIAECGVGNAREQILGKAPTHIWIDDNGPADIMRGVDAIQQKFVQSGGHLSLRAVLAHFEHYPDYLANGGKYQIPKDHYDRIMEHLAMPADVANKLPTSTGEFSLRQWQEVHEFFETSGLTVDDIEPSIFEYGDVQQGTIAGSLEEEKGEILETDQERRDSAYEESKPTLKEGVKVAAISAAVEGLTEFCLAIVRKRKAGKKIKEFTQEDWVDIAGDSGKGVIKGGIRGTSIYLLTNYTATPGAVASAVVTASFGVADQIHKFRTGAISEVQFIENAEMLCLDASVSALSTLVGQVIIPVPVLGAIIGNAVGTLMYQIGKDCYHDKEREIINGYLAELKLLDEALDEQYQAYILKLNENFKVFLQLTNAAFSPDVATAFEGSIELARVMGVPTDEILDSHKKVVSYFTE